MNFSLSFNLRPLDVKRLDVKTLGCNWMLNTKEDKRTAGRRKVGRKTPSCKTMNPKR